MLRQGTLVTDSDISEPLTMYWMNPTNPAHIIVFSRYDQLSSRGYRHGGSGDGEQWWGVENVLNYMEPTGCVDFMCKSM